MNIHILKKHLRNVSKQIRHKTKNRKFKGIGTLKEQRATIQEKIQNLRK